MQAAAEGVAVSHTFPAADSPGTILRRKLAGFFGKYSGYSSVAETENHAGRDAQVILPDIEQSCAQVVRLDAPRDAV